MRATAAKRDTALQALQLRAAGSTYRQIADALGLANAMTAWRLVNVELENVIRESAQEILNLELTRLDRLLMGIWPDAIQGDHAAIDRALKIEDMRCKLLGLYDRAAQQHQDVVPQGAIIIPAEATSSEYIAALRQIRGELPPPSNGNGHGS